MDVALLVLVDGVEALAVVVSGRLYGIGVESVGGF